ncbi:MAG: efflux RND transporter periplasmic adaptor subunit [Gammaproteobacteria bacterium]|nr:efflux RND transporter periplasmic adaptor subunit [Gammaproteobacteria bacterium]
MLNTCLPSLNTKATLTSSKILILSTLLSLLLIILAGCDSSIDDQKAAARAAPPPGVLVVKAARQEIRDTVVFIGRTVAINDVSLQAQVSGYLKARSFEEGSDVEIGDSLFEIDPSIYAAQVAAAKGSVAEANAALVRADKDLKRYRQLLKKQSVSQQKVDEAESLQLQADAKLKSARAALQKAELDLGFTQIKSPIKGRIGRAVVSVGNLVSPQSGELARLIELDPIYVNFSISEKNLINVRKRKLKAQQTGIPEIEVELILPDKSVYDRKGELDFIDNMVDPRTGTITVRARFENPEMLLVPGLYVSTVLATQERQSELMIPQSAVQEDQAGRFVMVVDPDDKVEVRRITTGSHVGGSLVVEDGLNPDERVVVEGVQKIRPGMKVTPKMTRLPGMEGQESESGDQDTDKKEG